MIYTKSALPGCGKTRWLIERAHEASHSGNYPGGVVFIGESKDYVKFCDKYLAIMDEVPHIDFEHNIPGDYCVLIDDIFTYMDSAERWARVNHIMKDAKDCYITINAETICNCKKNKSTDVDPNQLSIFDI